MPRYLLLLLLPFLPACQGNGRQPPATAASADTGGSDSFDRDTGQSYDIQTGQYQQEPPFGARSNR